MNNTLVLIPHLNTTGSVAYSNARFGQGTGPIALSNLVCSGTETSIFDCRHSGLFNVGTCTHAEDASVECSRECQDGEIRLRGGTNQFEGRVEICFNRVWGTVCDDFWGTVDAAVACRQLGYSGHSKDLVRCIVQSNVICLC